MPTNYEYPACLIQKSCPHRWKLTGWQDELWVEWECSRCKAKGYDKNKINIRVKYD